MSIAERKTQTVWEGALATGVGTFANSSSTVLDGQQVTWVARTEAPGGKTSPEELIAAAHSSCFSMALALTLGEHKHTPEKLDVTSTVTLDAVDGVPTITTSAIKVVATVPGLGADDFDRIIDEAAKLCPVSRVLAGAQITVDATLAG